MQTASVLTLDLHGKNTYQAKVAIEAALRRAGGAYRLCLIHGYRQGDAIRTMIYEAYAHDPRILSILPGANPGQTELVRRKL